VKITAVLLPTVEEQRANGDDLIIDPAIVQTPTPGLVQAWIGFGYRVPDDLFGRVTRVWVEDGRLMGEIEVYPGKDPFHFSVGGYDTGHAFELLQVGVLNGKRGRHGHAG